MQFFICEKRKERSKRRDKNNQGVYRRMTKNWKLKEIVLLSIISVVAGVLYMFFVLFASTLRNILTPIGLAPFSFEFVFGLWFIGSVVAMYIIRKPGAALFTGIISAGVEILAGGPGGAKVLLIGLVQGAGIETAFLLTKYKNYHLRVLILSGMIAAIYSFIYQLFASGNMALAPTVLIGMLSIRLISGALLSGVLGKWIADKLAFTGVLDGYALGKEVRKKREKDAA